MPCGDGHGRQAGWRLGVERWRLGQLGGRFGNAFRGRDEHQGSSVEAWKLADHLLALWCQGRQRLPPDMKEPGMNKCSRESKRDAQDGGKAFDGANEGFLQSEACLESKAFLLAVLDFSSKAVPVGTRSPRILTLS
jgi:hypothetical protein